MNHNRWRIGRSEYREQLDQRLAYTLEGFRIGNHVGNVDSLCGNDFHLTKSRLSKLKILLQCH